MKYLCFLFFVIVLQSHASDLSEQLFEGFEPTNNEKLLTETNRLSTLSGTASLSGVLYDADSGELIPDNTNMSLSIIGRVDETDSWGYIQSVNVENSVFEFNDLADGQYLISARNKSFEPDINEPTYYLPTLWHANYERTQSYYPQPPMESIINIENGESKQDIDFRLAPAALLVITDNDNNGEYFLGAYILDSENQMQTAVSYTRQDFANGVVNTQRMLYQYLPQGEYKFFVTSHQPFANNTITQQDTYVGYIYGFGDCYVCWLEIEAGKGEVITLSKFEKKTVNIQRNHGATISGKISFEGSEYQDGNIATVHLRSSYRNFLNSYTLYLDLNEQNYVDYKFSGLAEGEYFLSAMKNDYTRKSYKDLDCLYHECLTSYDLYPIRVSKRENLTGVDMLLKTPGVKIKGSIVDNQTGEMLLDDDTQYSYDLVEVYDENLNYVGGNYDYEGSGYYWTSRIPPGRYYIKTGFSSLNASNRNYANQIFPGVECEGNNCDFSKAQLVELSLDEPETIVNFRLNPAKSISGRVIDETDNSGIKDMLVVVLNEQEEFVDVTKTDSEGNYKLKGLKSGNYYVRTNNGSRKIIEGDLRNLNPEKVYRDKLYPNIDCGSSCNISEAGLINIADEDVENINFSLAKGSSIDGQVKDNFRDTAIKHVEVKIYSESGEYLESYFTDNSGFYKTSALAPGTYKIITNNERHYVNQAYGGNNCGISECDVSLSEIVTVTDINISGIDFSLMPGTHYYPDLNGLWNNPEQFGHGVQMEVLKQNGYPVLFISWYTMSEGVPIWLTGTGPLNKDLAYVDLYITDGASFPPNFESEDVNANPWGLMTINFNSSNHAEISWDSYLEGFEDGSLMLRKFTYLSDFKRSNGTIDACLSGSFYNRDQSGHGIIVEILGGNAERVLMTWFTYKDGEQFWLLGNGTVDENKVTLSSLYTTGTDFPPYFDSNQVQVKEWGEIELIKLSNNEIKMKWTPNVEHYGFGEGEIVMNRLTKITGMNCSY